MLTKNDLTIQNALDVFDEIKDTGVRHIGFKDIGLPMDKLKILVQRMKKQDMRTYLEVVSESEEANVKSVKSALELGVDNLIGGSYVEQTLKLMKGKKLGFFPYIGKIVGHPCLLRGSIEEIVADGKKKKAMGIDGINLLAYRYDGNVEELITSVQKAVKVPLIVAGSIDSFERVRRMKDLKVDGFTIGGAILDKKFVLNGSSSDQMRAVLKETGEIS
jgi:NAD(P)H-dependent flavin oxidoreductase YrpB (nitropropane dioxygenase family)